MSTNQESALGLVERAYNADRESVVNMLLDAAKRLDETLDTHSIKSLWLEKWMKQNANRCNLLDK